MRVFVTGASGWIPSRPTLAADLADGAYFPVAAAAK